MQTAPTTSQIIDGLRIDVRESVVPEVGSEPARITLEMLDNLLSNLSQRAAHEIAWMRDECTQIEALARRVADPAVVAAVTAYEAVDRVSLHLVDVQRAYDAASEVLSCTIEHALARGDRVLVDRCRAVLRLRSERELTILGAWTMAGRG